MSESQQEIIKGKDSGNKGRKGDEGSQDYT